MNSRRFRPPFFTFEVALDSSRQVLSFLPFLEAVVGWSKSAKLLFRSCVYASRFCAGRDVLRSFEESDLGKSEIRVDARAGISEDFQIAGNTKLAYQLVARAEFKRREMKCREDQAQIKCSVQVSCSRAEPSTSAVIKCIQSAGGNHRSVIIGPVSPSQLGGRHSNPVVTTPMIALDFSGTTQQSASHNVAPNQITKITAELTADATSFHRVRKSRQQASWN
ncbi:F-box/FBD/LRR-repeat protein-like [Dorcoceras hygrometricum]|uniref:F-box/FBD/LRR-repeat protein-like n=1 Tax=Dorcoceras hygrometricum TaxID=472368 RepID=A0A2Z7B2W5_9LAMI|nr:F-box/FBD/LRR-repeat protein-like [Dorcoceras hygrometricum]